VGAEAAKIAPKLVTREVALRELGVTYQTLWRYQKEGCPHVPMAGNQTFYDMDKVRAWMVANGYSGKVGRPEKGSPEAELDETKRKLLEARLKKEEALAAKHNHQLAVAQGKVFAKDEIIEGQLKRIATVKAGLLALPGKLAQRLAHREALDIQRELHEEVLALLDSFSKGTLTTDKDTTDKETPCASTTPSS